MTNSTSAPVGLVCDLMACPEKGLVCNAEPRFGWVFRGAGHGARQTAYHILVATAKARLAHAEGDMWDTGRTGSEESVGVSYGGRPLASNRDYYWQVRTWDSTQQASPWSAVQHFRTGRIVEAYTTPAYALETLEVAPVEVVEKGPGHYFVDFGKAMFGTLRLSLPKTTPGGVVQVHLGEALEAPGRVQRKPPGCVRYLAVDLHLEAGADSATVRIPADRRNTGTRAVRMPADIGEVLPFRYCELVNCLFPADASGVCQVAVRYPFDRDAAAFTSASPALNRVWDLCRHTIEATTFCGLYVDGDRERIPYEADAFINQLGHYCVDREFTLARRTHEYLLDHPTWPTEWILHSLPMAWVDYEHTGDIRSMAHRYEDLKAKTLMALARDDGLVSTGAGRVTDAVMDSVRYGAAARKFFGRGIGDIVDWPPGSFAIDGTGERDGHEMKDVNTVVNAFHYRALVLIGRIAAALGKHDDADRFSRRASLVERSFQQAFFDPARGLYVDGEGSSHSSLHSNMFALAFGLVPEDRRGHVVEFVKSRGMACSVYGAQYLLEALYQVGEADHALALMLAEHDRGWLNMIRAGSTMTLEAWDLRYKKNLDWNHAWGAAPANIIPRRLMGVRPLEPGFGKILVQPQPGNLEWASLRLPTIRGTVAVAVENRPGHTFTLHIEIPGNVSAKVALPCQGAPSRHVRLDAQTVEAAREGSFLVVDGVGSGSHTLCW